MKLKSLKNRITREDILKALENVENFSFSNDPKKIPMKILKLLALNSNPNFTLPEEIPPGRAFLDPIFEELTYVRTYLLSFVTANHENHKDDMTPGAEDGRELTEWILERQETGKE
jgi:hypothetical protein